MGSQTKRPVARRDARFSNQRPKCGGTVGGFDPPGYSAVVVGAARHPLTIAAATLAAVTLVSAVLPAEHAATGVGLCFCAATYGLVLRYDTATIRSHGLSLGGVLEPQPLDWRRLLGDAGRAGGWALLCSALFLPPFMLGYVLWWQPVRPLVWAPGETPLGELMGQLLVIALPEEMFFRGYLQSRLDVRWPPAWRIAGARIGRGLLVSSAIFALGHLLTTPQLGRLSVFFPSLVFGWLRARTGGIGAAVLFHAACNLFAAYLGRGFGFFP